MRSLVLYYSQTGHTAKVASILAKALDADLARYTCHAYEAPLGGLRQFWDIATGGTPPIELPEAVEYAYDLVVVAGPIWAARPAPPVRSLLKRRPPIGHHQAVVLTCDGTSPRSPGEKGLTEAVGLGTGGPLATGLFKAADIESPDLATRIAVFAETVRRAAPNGTLAASNVTPFDRHSHRRA